MKNGPSPLRPALSLIAALAFSLQASAEIRYVLHITVDGLRGDLLKNLIDTDPDTYLTFAKLRQEGASTFNARCDFDYSETIPNHSGVVTGRPVVDPPGQTGVAHGYTSNGYSGNATTGDSIHKLGSATYVYRPGTFDTAHDRGLSTAIYGGKTRLNLFVHSYNATKGRPDPIPPDNGSNKVDFASVADLTSAASLPNVKNAVVADIAAGTLRNYSLVHFTDTDTGATGGGHNVGWGSASWNNAVKAVDGYLAAILTELNNANPAIKGKVAIVLTADHGGGGGGSGPGATADRNHGDAASQLNYTIPVLIWGPGIPAGSDAYRLFSNRFNPAAARPNGAAITNQPLRNADTANIAMALLGLPAVEGSYFRPALDGDLRVNEQGGSVTLSWPSYLTNHRLEWSDDLTSGSWQADADPQPVEEGGRFVRQATLPSSTRRFWRVVPPQ